MRPGSGFTAGRLLIGLGAGLMVLAVSLVMLAWSGLYNVAASAGHQAWIEQFLAFGLERSIKTWALTVEGPPQDLRSEARVRIGAAHFYGGCASCHGSPGADVNALHRHMLPAPPKLTNHNDHWTPEQLFQIVRHGIQYTGMPFWSGAGRGDEVWSVVAFLLEMPELPTAAYRDLVRGNTQGGDIPAARLVGSGNSAAHLTACDRCHDTASRGPISELVPRLAGQSRDYIARALYEYRQNRRQSGIMEPVASELDDSEIEKLADYYARLAPPPNPAPDTMDEQRVNRGQQLATWGDIARGVPPCDACHNTDAIAAFPRLAAQPAAYIEAQLQLWQRGGRAQTPTGSLMAVIAKRLDGQQIGDAAAHFQSLPPPTAESGGAR